MKFTIDSKVTGNVKSESGGGDSFTFQVVVDVKDV